jgi:STAS domain
VIAAEPVTDVDTTASDVLEELGQALEAQGISLVFAELKDPVRRKIERYGLARTIEPRHFFPTIEDAVTTFCQQNRRPRDRRHQPAAGQTARGRTATDAGPPGDIPASPPAGAETAGREVIKSYSHRLASPTTKEQAYGQAVFLCIRSAGRERLLLPQVVRWLSQGSPGPGMWVR